MFALVGIGAAAATRAGRHGLTLAGRPASVPLLLAAAGVVVLVGWNLAHQPPSVAPDGSFADAEAETARDPGDHRRRPVRAALAARLQDGGGDRLPAHTCGPRTGTGDVRVIRVVGRGASCSCDPMFEVAIGATCGGPAEDAAVQARLDSGTLRLAERFTLTARRVISIYLRPG